MNGKILSEFEFKRILCDWLIKYDRCFIYERDYTLDDIAEAYRLPDLDYVHTQSQMNDKGNLVTFLKGKITLSSTRARNSKYSMNFVFYKVLETPTDTPEVEPFPAGYIIYEIDTH